MKFLIQLSFYVVCIVFTVMLATCKGWPVVPWVVLAVVVPILVKKFGCGSDDDDDPPPPTAPPSFPSRPPPPELPLPVPNSDENGQSPMAREAELEFEEDEEDEENKEDKEPVAT